MLLAADEAVILDLCDGSTPFVVKRDELVDYRKFEPAADRLDSSDVRCPVRLGAVVSHGAQPVSRVRRDAVLRTPRRRVLPGVATDEVLLPLYPEAPDLTGARHRLTLFLAQYWGGPHTYDDERGQPMLRMRHMPFRDRPGSSATTGCATWRTPSPRCAPTPPTARSPTS